MIIKKNIYENIINLPRVVKQTLAIICDLCICLIAVVLAFYLRLDVLLPLRGPLLTAFVISFFLAIPIFWIIGLYKIIFRYSGLNIIFSVSVAISVYGLIYFCIFTLYRIEGIPRSIGVLQPMILFFGIIFSRLVLNFILSNNVIKNKNNLVALIYGAGSSGRQLARSLEQDSEIKAVGFIDDDDDLHGKILQGLFVYNPNNLEKLIKHKNIKMVLIALPYTNRFRRKEILKKLKQYNLIVQILPSVNEIVGGKVILSDIKNIESEKLLNREVITAKKELLLKNIKDQVVLVTGAGGSIGSELCRQIIENNPKSLILCEFNEFALYKIFNELSTLKKKLKIIPLLVNIQNKDQIIKVLKIFKVETVYHAAAFKHVPLVESNICAGVLNNVFGTYAVVDACVKQSVLNLVLISSDKAVRPTNIMGATKRLSELCMQALYFKHRSENINMSMVRFGNVLESSGSVVPKFKEQIQKGGPVTLTHPDVTRYFMTIKEAAGLVIQAGAMSKNGDVFVLKMGKSIKVKDLIENLIYLSGLTIKNEENPEGDIEIKIIGLRPGEKLYEELLLGVNPQPTDHEKIQKAQDPFVPFEKLKKDLDILKSLSVDYKACEVKKKLKDMIKSYVSEYKIVDYMFMEKESLNKIDYENNSINSSQFSKIANTSN